MANPVVGQTVNYVHANWPSQMTPGIVTSVTGGGVASIALELPDGGEQLVNNVAGASSPAVGQYQNTNYPNTGTPGAPGTNGKDAAVVIGAAVSAPGSVSIPAGFNGYIVVQAWDVSLSPNADASADFGTIVAANAISQTGNVVAGVGDAIAFSLQSP